MTETVFLSYSHADRSLARRVEKHLKGLLKSKSQDFVVIDERQSVSVGEDIRKSLKAAMDSANTVVFLASPKSDGSQWMNYEAGLADALGKRMVVISPKGKGKSALQRNFPKGVQWIELDDKSLMS